MPITWTNADLQSIGIYRIYLRAIVQEVLNIRIDNTSLKLYFSNLKSSS